MVFACGSATDPNATSERDGLCSDDSDCDSGFLCEGGQCIPANCVDLTQNGNETDIDCGGDCAPCTEGQACVGSGDCSTGFCNGESVCRDCTDDRDCQGNTHCTGGMCAPRKDNGDSCELDTECTSGFCADGVCCDGPCDGQCQACTSSGVCMLVTAGEDPRDDCAESPAGTCGTDGTCDGAGGCRLRGSGVGCDLPTCGGGGVGECDGEGSCPDPGGISCAPYVCSGDDVNCRTSCTQRSHCDADSYCDLETNTCKARLNKGGACEPDEADSCKSGFSCVEPIDGIGVCCESACTGGCNSCRGSITGDNDGECEPVPSGEDPVAAGTCTVTGTCGNTGKCDGGGACDKADTNVQCAAATCSNGQELSAAYCTGTGACNNQTQSSCAPYSCGTDACLDSCSGVDDCQSGKYCASGDVCADGCDEHSDCGSQEYCDFNTNSCESGCSGDAQCGGGFCVDNGCVECEDDNDCSGVCVNNSCEECRYNSDCTSGYCSLNDCYPWKDPGDFCSSYSQCEGDCADRCCLPGEGFCNGYCTSGGYCIQDNCEEYQYAICPEPRL